MTNARLLRDRKMLLADGGIVQIRIWEVPASVPPSEPQFKYSLYYGKAGERLVGYDNERGKGDHKHVNGVEMAYSFTGIDRLLDDFLADVAALRGESI